MRILKISLVFFLSFVFSQAFAHQQAAMHGMKYDREILAWLVVLNKNEIAASDIAMKKHTSRMVNDYAHYLHAQHERNLQQTMHLSQAMRERPLKTQMALGLQKEGEQAGASLKALQGPAFDQAFIQAMISGHQAALHQLNQLIAEVKNPALLNQLKMTRAMVASHLKKALTIQNHMHSQGPHQHQHQHAHPHQHAPQNH